MEAPMVYPTAPFDTQAQQHNIDAPPAHAGTGENVESSGKAKSVLSKAKRKLKDKIKKVRGGNTASTEHGDNKEYDKRDFNDVLGPDGEEVDDGAESYEDDEEEEDHMGKTNNNQFFHYQQLRSIGALDKQRDGSEIEVHGGVPVSTLAANPGTYWKSADDSAPISPYKSAGPPDALQATPTKYRNYAANDDPLFVGGEEKATSSTPNGLVEDIILRGPDEDTNPPGSQSLPETKTSNVASYYEPVEPHSRHDAVDTASASNIDVPYPEDLVKPNPSFGKSSSPTYDKIAVMNEDLSADGKLGFGLSSEVHSGNGKRNLLETSVPEFEELSGSQGNASVPTEADKLVYRHFSDLEVGKAVELPKSGVVDKMPLKGERDIYPTGAYANETDYAISYGEQKPIFNTARDGALEQLADGVTATEGDSEHEIWGKWSADKINNVKDNNTGLVGTDHTNERKTQQNSTHVLGDADKVHEIQGDDVPKPAAFEYVNEDAEEEFYDPNEVKNNQFQEAFELGSAEEDALSGTLTGSAIEKLQGLKETVAASLGYSNHEDNGEERPGFEGEQRALSPSQQQGFVQGLKETVASSLGYGKAASHEASDNNDIFERGEESEINVDNREQQSGGTLQGLKNVVAAKLGYGMAEESPVLTKESESQEFPSEATSHEPIYEERGEHGSVIEAGHALSDVGDNAHREDEVSRQQQSGGVLQGVKDMVISKFGYNYRPGDAAYREASVASGDQQPNSYTEKLFNTTAAAREYLSSKVGGYGSGMDDKEERDLNCEDDGDMLVSPSTHVDNNIVVEH